MRVSGMLSANLDQAPQAIAELEARGYDAAFSAEINNDPFFPLVLAAEHSETIALTTSISVAFARNPMTMANLAWDLNQYAKGCFTLGLGSQIKPHITRRFSMPWSRPAARMREFILAMQAIWTCWETGGKLAFEGEFYQHNLMTPMFVPADATYGGPAVNLAAVGPSMVQNQLAFYASTPAYRPVLELHGWGELQAEAHRLTREGRWQDMGELITDDILHTFAIVSEHIEQVPALLTQRYGSLVDTWMCTVDTGDSTLQRHLIADIQNA